MTEAQGYRSCQNILALGKSDKQLLERACGQLVSEQTRRAISYTAVKQRLAALRRRVSFEVSLFVFSLYYWGVAVGVELLRAFGRSAKSKKLVELYDAVHVVEPPQ